LNITFLRYYFRFDTFSIQHSEQDRHGDNLTTFGNVIVQNLKQAYALNYANIAWIEIGDSNFTVK